MVFDPDRLVADCLAAAAAQDPQAAIRELVAQAVSDPAACVRGLGEP